MEVSGSAETDHSEGGFGVGTHGVDVANKKEIRAKHQKTSCLLFLFSHFFVFFSLCGDCGCLFGLSFSSCYPPRKLIEEE